MKEKFLNDKINNVHFVGVGGVSMSGLAKHLHKCGYEVSGSDRTSSKNLKDLVEFGVKVSCGHSHTNVENNDLTVYSSAIGNDNPELKKSKERGIECIKRSLLLGRILNNYSKSVAISGSHGKTTATAMIARILIKAGNDPTVFLGGEDRLFGNYKHGNSEYAIAEACEYKKSFLDLKPKIAVVLNIDNDHLDSYADMNDLVNSFELFVGNNLAVINADDQYADRISNCTTITFGIQKVATYYATKIKKTDKGYSFSANAYSKNCGRINLAIKGEHNIYNALCAFAVADVLGVPFNIIKSALEEFRGVKRRNEFLGEAYGKSWYADYAHHPREIFATLKAFTEEDGELITVFQPHTYSRTRLLLQDFIKSFNLCEKLIIFKTYPAREKYDKKGSAKTLAEEVAKKGVCKCLYAHTTTQLFNLIKEEKSCKRILVLGAGDLYDIVKKKTFCAKEEKIKLKKQIKCQKK